MRPTDAEILAAMETVRNPPTVTVFGGDDCQYSRVCVDVFKLRNAESLLARELVRRVDAGELFEVRGLELKYFGAGRWKIPTVFGEWELHHYGRDDDTDVWIIDFMGNRTQDCDTKEKAVAAANRENVRRLRAALRPAFAADGTREHKENA